jgi:tetratricopeptide (TPR) repeat protein
MAMAMAMAMAMETRMTRHSDAPDMRQSATSGLLIFRAIVIFGCAAALALSAALNAFVNVAERGNPSLALQLDPDNPVALAARGDIAWTEEKSAVNDQNIKKMARQSLRGLALNPKAIRLLGFAHDADRQPKVAHRLMALAEKTSRRDIGTQLWMIESAVTAGDVRKTLHHYNTALLTNPQTDEVLFPKLAAALDDGEIRAAAAPIVRSDPSWLSAFMGHVIWNSAHADSLAQTIMGAGGLRDTAENRSTESQLIGRLSAQGKYDTARQFYLSLKGADRNVLQSAALRNVSERARYAPISWKLEASSGVGAVANGQGSNTQMQVYASPAANGIAAQKLLFLRRGDYALSFSTGPVALNAGANAYWIVNCVTVDNARPILRQDILPGTALRLYKAAFKVDETCPSQLLQLVASGGEGQSDTSFAVQAISISPL